MLYTRKRTERIKEDERMGDIQHICEAARKRG
jgi:hypothetical protein